MNIVECDNCTQCSCLLKKFEYDFALLFEDELGLGTLPVLVTKEDAVIELQLSSICYSSV
jgi:hypothetical protein